MAISTTDTAQGTTNDFEARLARLESYLGFTQAAPVDPAARQAEMKAASDAAAAEQAAQDDKDAKAKAAQHGAKTTKS